MSLADRLARIAERFGDVPRTEFWRRSASDMRDVILKRAWSDKRGSFVDCFEGEHLDAGLLLMLELGFIAPDDPRMTATFARIEETLAHGPFVRRYEAPDDFGAPKTTFNICAFWRVDALARMGRIEEARASFEALLARRNMLGLMSEDSDKETGELWGNFPQTYSMVGIINCAMRLSQSWEKAL
jgi:GH15 family glucan-1,4-alpha-glucosidase